MLQVAHNHEERDQCVVLVESSVDTKGDDQIVSRLGVALRADLPLSPGQDLRAALQTLSAHRSDLSNGLACVLIDEAQFLTPEQVNQALAIAVQGEIPVVAFGIRKDFRAKAFPGSQRSMEVAHSLQEMTTICRCGNKAIFDARLGEQVMIDGEVARYEALCARCYLETEGA